MSFWTSAHIHLDLFIWQTLIQSDLQRIQGLRFISSCVSANRTRDLAISCTCSSGWVMCLERESEWLNWMCQQKRKRRSLSQASWSPYWDRGGIWPETRVQRTRPNRIPPAAVRFIWAISTGLFVFSLTHFHLYWAEFIILCNKIKY